MDESILIIYMVNKRMKLIVDSLFTGDDNARPLPLRSPAFDKLFKTIATEPRERGKRYYK